MAFCANCGSEVQGRFCAKCGSAVAAGPAAGSAAPPPPPPPQQSYAPPQQQSYPQAAQSAGMTDNMAAALCYILGLLTGILFLVLAPYNQNRTIRFHAFQSIFLNIAWIATAIATMVVSFALSAIPFLGVAISLVLHLAIGVGFFILWIMLMYKAYNNERWVLPVIGPLAEKQA